MILPYLLDINKIQILIRHMYSLLELMIQANQKINLIHFPKFSFKNKKLMLLEMRILFVQNFYNLINHLINSI